MAARLADRLRTGAVRALAGAAVLAAGGCASITSTPGTGSAALATQPTPPPATPAVLTGTRLARLLLPASAMPAGFSLAPASARNSGGGVVNDTSTLPPPGQMCQLLTKTSWLLAAGITGAAFAQNGYANTARTGEIGQEIDAFQGTDAQEVMSRLWMVFRRCAAFTARSGGHTGEVTGQASLLPGPGGGAVKADAMKLVLTSSLYRGGETLVAIRVGNNIVTCFDSTPRASLGAAAVTLAGRLAGRLAAVTRPAATG